MTKKLWIPMLATVAGFVLLANAAGPHGHGRSVSMKSRGAVTSCSDMEVTFDRRPAVTAEEQRTIPRAVGTLKASPMENGGIEVIGWDRNEYSVTLCKAASPDQRELLGQISLSVQGGRVSVQGPSSDEDWTAYLIVRTPKDGALDLEAHNGPIGLHGVNGRVTARAVNGPISMKNCEGEIDVETQNGPIDWSGGGGNVRLRAQNGPLNLEVPENYASAVRVETSEHSPVRCRATQCRQAMRMWEHPSRIEFGKGEPVVRLTTVNGPVNLE